MNNVGVISFLPSGPAGEDQSRIVQDLGFSGYGNLVAVFEYVEGSPYGNVQAAMNAFDIGALPTVIVGAVQGKDHQTGFSVNKFYPVERFESQVSEEELKRAIDRVAKKEIDPVEGSAGKGFIDFGQESKGGGAFGINPFGLFGLPWWLLLAAGFILYQTTKD